MATLANHIDNYAKCRAVATAHLLDYYQNETDVNFRCYERAWDRLQVTAQVLENLGIKVEGHVGFKDPKDL